MIDLDVFGSGEDVILLHGNPVPPESLDPIRKALQDSHRVLVPDLTATGLDPDELRPRIERALVAHGVRRAAIVGHSLGTYRAFQVAIAGNLEVTRIFALSPLAYLPDEVRQGFEGLAAALESNELGCTELASILAQRWFGKRYVAANLEIEAVLSRWFESVGRGGLIASGRVETALADLRPTLSMIEVPVHVRVGADDQATPVTWAREIVDLLPRAQLEVLEGVGHFPQYEDPEGTIRAVRAFLAA